MRKSNVSKIDMILYTKIEKKVFHEFYDEYDIVITEPFFCHILPVNSICYLEYENCFATTSLDCVVKIWSVENLDIIGKL